MSLCLNRWGKHQNKQQNAWQAEVIRIKIDRVHVCTSAAEGGREEGRKQGVSPTRAGTCSQGPEDSLQQTQQTQGAHSMPAACFY